MSSSCAVLVSSTLQPSIVTITYTHVSLNECVCFGVRLGCCIVIGIWFLAPHDAGQTFALSIFLALCNRKREFSSLF